jgi:hypothetical protein
MIGPMPVILHLLTPASLPDEESGQGERAALCYPIGARPHDCAVGTYYTEKPLKKVAESAGREGHAPAPASQDGAVASERCTGLTSLGTAATMRLFGGRPGEAI